MLFSILVIGTLTGGVYSLFVVVFNGVIVGETLYTIFKSGDVPYIHWIFTTRITRIVVHIFNVFYYLFTYLYSNKNKTVSFLGKKSI